MSDIDAIVLHNIDYRDSSKILYLYSKDGHQSVIAHRVKKMNSINRFLSQNGTLIRCRISSGKLPSLQDGELLDEYQQIKQDVVAYSYMNHIMELTRNTITDDSNHPKMFSFLTRLFTLMNQGDDPELLSFIFELKLLYFLGHGIHFSGCTMCEENDDLVFHVASGGLVCRHHVVASDTYYEQDLYNQIYHLYRIDIDNQSLPDIQNTDRVIIRHIIDLLYNDFVGYKSKSRAILKQILKY